MAVDAASFIIDFPEFSETDTALIDAKIADAVGRVSAETWADLTDQGVKYLAAHLIAMSPLGEQSRLELKAGPDAGKSTTEYFLEYDRILRSVTMGCRTI